MKKIRFFSLTLIAGLVLFIYSLFNFDPMTMTMGHIFLKKGESDLAYKAYSLVEGRTKSDRLKSESLVRLGRVALQDHEPKVAFVRAAKALNLDKKNAEAYDLAAFSIIMADKNYSVAIDLLRKANELKPDNIHYKELMAYALASNQQYAEAVSLYEEILPKETELKRITDIQHRLAIIKPLLEAKKT